MTFTVSLDRERLKVKIKEFVLQNIQKQIGSPTHTNRDGSFSPAQWYSNWETFERKTLATSASIALDGDIIKVTLNYEVQVIDE